MQDVFTVLVEKLPDFRKDPRKRFWGWSWTIRLSEACAVVQGRQKND
jgi:hypothetical protein